METDYGTAEEIKIKRVETQVSYMPFFTSDNTNWMSGCLWRTEQEAIDSVKYYPLITRLRIMKIELPSLNVEDNVDI